MAGQSQPICVDLRLLAAKKSLRQMNRADVMDISIWLYEYPILYGIRPDEGAYAGALQRVGGITRPYPACLPDNSLFQQW